jgi:hypothetical protein
MYLVAGRRAALGRGRAHLGPYTIPHMEDIAEMLRARFERGTAKSHPSQIANRGLCAASATPATQRSFLRSSR